MWIKSGQFERLRTLLAVPMLGLLSLFLISCSTTPQVIKPDGALTISMDKPELEGNTWRDLAEAYITRGEVIDGGNARFKAIRD